MPGGRKQKSAGSDENNDLLNNTSVDVSSVDDTNVQTILQAIRNSEIKLGKKLDTQITGLRESLTLKLNDHETLIAAAEGNIGR